MKLYLTPLSHFSRKVVLVLEELGLEYEREYVPNLLSADPTDFGGNPILRVPVLEHDGEWIVESDAIMHYLIDRFDADDRFGMQSLTVKQRNALSFLSSIMAAEVELILSARAGVEHPEYFDRYRVVIERCLGWIEEHGPQIWPGSEFRYLDLVLVCMWDHLQHSGLVEHSEQFAWIHQRAALHADRPSVRSTSCARMQELQWQLYPSQRPSAS